MTIHRSGASERQDNSSIEVELRTFLVRSMLKGKLSPATLARATEVCGVPVVTTGNQALDALADAIAARVLHRVMATLEKKKGRLLDVSAAAEYIGRTPSALRHLIAKGKIPCVRRDGRVQLDRQDLDNWLELGKTRG
jgi:excisionase family DNA binding protein